MYWQIFYLATFTEFQIATAQEEILRNRHHFKYHWFQPGQDKVADFDLDDEAMDETIRPESEPEESDVIEQAGESDESVADGIQQTRSGQASKQPDYLNPSSYYLRACAGVK